MATMYMAEEMSLSQFHEETEHVSASDITAIFNTCPAAWRFADKQEASKARLFGMTARANFLDEARFKSEFFRLPTREEYPDALVSDADIKAWLKSRGIAGYSSKKFPELLQMVRDTGEKVQVWKDIEMQAREEAGQRLAIPGGDYDACLMMRDVMMLNPDYRHYLTAGYKEVSIFGEIDGVPVKCRIDCVTPDGVIVGYHTTQNTKPDAFSRKAPEYGYYLKKWIEYSLFTQAYGSRPSAVKIMAQEKTAPYLAMVHVMKPEQLRIGASQARETLATFDWCRKHDQWPSYAGGVAEVELQTPQYILKKYREILGENQ